MRGSKFTGPMLALMYASSVLAEAQAPPNTASTATPSHGGEVVDPELERAAAEDAATRELAQLRPQGSGSVYGPIHPSHGKLNPDIGFILDLGGAWFSHADHAQQGGHSMNDNGLAVQGFELAASAAVDPYFRFDTYVQLTEAEVEEAFFTTLSLPWNLQARGGLMNAAFGRLNAMHLHSWRFSNPALSHTRFMSSEHLRGPGVELSVLLPLPWYLNVIGQIFGTTEELGFNAKSFGSSEGRPSGRIEGPKDFLYVARIENFVELSANWSLLVGASEAVGQSQYRAESRAYLHGGDVYLKWRPISSGQGDIALALTAEYLVRDTALETGRLRDHGGFVEFAQHLSKRWMTALRFDTTSIWQGRIPAPTDAEPDPVIAGWQRRGSMALTFLPTHFSKLRVQGDVGKEQDREGLRHTIFLQAEVSAGEHGAHKF